ncbi:DUF3888 domain-containing protein [Priestia filamentosa]|nr:DUF3888 domain-containing protein [Priestia filamentosa]
MKIIILVISIIMLIMGPGLSNPVKADTEKRENFEEHNDFYDAFLTLLDPYARTAIEKKYPERSYSLWNAKILQVQRLTNTFSNFTFIVKVKFDTFTGPHNPPEGDVVITFKIEIDGVQVLDIKG